MEQPAAVERLSRRPPQRPVAGKERCASRRCSSPLLFCEVLGDDAPAWQADVLNCSLLGACLALARRVEPGSVLRLHLSNRRQLCARVVSLRVIWCRGQPAGPCLVGAVFENPLSQAALAALLS